MSRGTQARTSRRPARNSLVDLRSGGANRVTDPCNLGPGRAVGAVSKRDRASQSSSIRWVNRLSEAVLTWPEPNAWFWEELEASRRVFGPRIKERVISDNYCPKFWDLKTLVVS